MGQLTRRIAWIALVAAVCVLYFCIDPLRVSWLPRCPLRMATGWLCPGCGSQRLLHALLHGDFAAAWHANPFLLLALPGILFLGWLELSRRRHPVLYMRVYSTPFIIAAGVALVAWGIGRNIMGI
ncbi:MAG: DUF2752 domain-containing protein [Muribaculaceae bacterium]|nr:DUF2752 domain-containing protein [Muribaculaceae bacterium]